MGQVTLEDGPRFRECFYRHIISRLLVFSSDHEENEKATEPTFSGDYSYYTKNPDGSYKLER